MMPKNKVIRSDMLANVEERSQDSRSFEIPTRAEREDLWPGDLVKLVFEGIGERLWVKVLTRSDEDGAKTLPFLGIIESESIAPCGDCGPATPAPATSVLHASRAKHSLAPCGDCGPATPAPATSVLHASRAKHSLDTSVHKGDKVSFGPEHVADIAHVILRKTRERHQQRISGDGLNSKFLVH
jgi:hypothetical protein